MKNADKVLIEMDFYKVGTFYIKNQKFVVDLEKKYFLLQNVIYIHTIEDEIIRVGSSKNKLKSRMLSWERDVSKSLKGQKSSTPLWEGELWNKILKNKVGTFYAREGTVVTTPCGKMNSYLSEESYLIGKFLPKMNRSKHR
jgi:hypothetical protein